MELNSHLGSLPPFTDEVQGWGGCPKAQCKQVSSRRPVILPLNRAASKNLAVQLQRKSIQTSLPPVVLLSKGPYASCQYLVPQPSTPSFLLCGVELGALALLSIRWPRVKLSQGKGPAGTCRTEASRHLAPQWGPPAEASSTAPGSFLFQHFCKTPHDQLSLHSKGGLPTSSANTSVTSVSRSCALSNCLHLSAGVGGSPWNLLSTLGVVAAHTYRS